MSFGVKVASSLLRSFRRTAATSQVNPFAAAAAASFNTIGSEPEVTQHAAVAYLLSPLDFILSTLPAEASEKVPQ